MPENTPSVDDIMNSHFSDVVDEPVVDDQVEEEVTEEPTEEIIEEEQEEESDYDKVPEKKKPKPEPEAEEDAEPQNESEARKSAKREGKRRKELEAEKKEWELERDRLTKELDEHRGKLTELETVRIKPEEHPDYVSKVEKARKDIRDEVEDGFEAPGKNALLQMSNLVRLYKEADVSDDRAKKIEDLKTDLAKKLFEDRELEDLDKDEKKEITAAIRLIKKNAGISDELNSLYTDLDKRSKNGTLAVGVREYEESTKPFQSIVDAVGDLSDEFIEENPDSVEAVVARIGKENPKMLSDAKRDVVELLFGQRPLTHAEIEKLEKNGTNIKEYLSNRTKALNEKRKKLLPFLIQGLVARGEFKKALIDANSVRKTKASEESEDDALQKISRKKVTVSPETKKIKSQEDIFAKYGLDD